MSISEKVALELVAAIQGLSTDKIKDIGKAQAESLKLTVSEQQKRDEAVKIIDKSVSDLAVLDKANKKLEADKSDLAKESAKHDERVLSHAAKESQISARENAVKDSELALTKKGNDLTDMQKLLISQKSALESREKSLDLREAKIAEQEANFNEAYAKVARK